MTLHTRLLWALVIAGAGAAACSGSEDDDGGPPVWSAVFENLPGGLLRAWGTSSKDVYVVGAGGQALHFDGKKWRRLSPGISTALWWVQGVGPDDIRMVGDGGKILRYRPSTDAFETLASPTERRLFGVWGAAPDDVWYVGGETGSNRGVVLRDDGTTIREVPLTATSSAVFFKVIGFASDDVWLVGQQGHAIHWDGSDYVETETHTALPLLGVHGGSDDELWAVGGVGNGVILEWNGTDWQEETPPATPQMIGVWAVDAEDVYACGFNGRIFRRSGGAWAEVAEKLPTFQDLHAIWVDDRGAIWATGGRLLQDPPTAGVLIRYGPPISMEVTE